MQVARAMLASLASASSRLSAQTWVTNRLPAWLYSNPKTFSGVMADITYPCYIERKDNSGYWYWIYYAKNGEEIARSSESYVKRSACEHSIRLVQNSSDDPIFYIE